MALSEPPGGAGLMLVAPRGGFVSFQLVVRMPEGGAYALSLKMPPPLEADLFREWFHLTRSVYRPDALVPVSAVYRSRMPEPDNRIPKQTVQAFWVDVWVPRSLIRIQSTRPTSSINPVNTPLLLAPEIGKIDNLFARPAQRTIAELCVPDSF